MRKLEVNRGETRAQLVVVRNKKEVIAVPQKPAITGELHAETVSGLRATKTPFKLDATVTTPHLDIPHGESESVQDKDLRTWAALLVLNYAGITHRDGRDLVEIENEFEILTMLQHFTQTEGSRSEISTVQKPLQTMSIDWADLSPDLQSHLERQAYERKLYWIQLQQLETVLFAVQMYPQIIHAQAYMPQLIKVAELLNGLSLDRADSQTNDTLHALQLMSTGQAEDTYAF